MMRSRSRWVGALLALAGAAFAAACAPHTAVPGTPPGSADGEAPLVSSLQVEHFPDSIALTLQVTNASATPVALTFNTGQSFDFIIEQAGREVWRWSGDQFFTQAIRHVTLAPGQTERFQASWRPGASAATGEYTAVGFLTAQEYRGEQRARFRVP